MAESTFKCANCGGTFPKAWSDDDAEAEASELWGNLPEDERSVICDDCFQQFMPWVRENHPEAVNGR